jgi:hypothetical protein
MALRLLACRRLNISDKYLSGQQLLHLRPRCTAVLSAAGSKALLVGEAGTQAVERFAAASPSDRAAEVEAAGRGFLKACMQLRLGRCQPA